MWEAWVQALSWENPMEKEMAAHSSILPEEFHGQRRLVGYSPWGHIESDKSEWLTLSLHFLVAKTVKNPPAVQKTWVQSLDWEDPLEEGMATHSSILA